MQARVPSDGVKEEGMEDRKPWMAAAIAAVILAGGLGGYFGYQAWQRRPAPAAVVPAPAPASAPTAAPAAPETGIRHPIETQVAEPATLPTLAMSDSAMRLALVQLIGAKPFADFFRPDRIIQRIVVTVDNLPRSKVAEDLRPVRPAAGGFAATAIGEAWAIAPANAARYAAYVKLIQSSDMQAVAALYARYYPLFQQAYVELGYPKGYFNDRLVEAIDDLLAAPDVKPPVGLVQPGVMYRYVDPGLEALSAGQKIMLRIGSENAAVVKGKLRELRQAVAQSAR